MIIRKDFLSKHSIFPALVLGLSVTNLFTSIPQNNNLSSIVSGIGIAGTILFALQIDLYQRFFYLWIAAQLFFIDHRIVDPVTHEETRKAIFDLGQVFTFKLHLSLRAKYEGEYSFGFNALALIYFPLLKILNLSAFIGQTLVFNQFRDDNRLGDVFPFEGVIERQIYVDDDENWLLVKLTTPFTFNDEQVTYVITKRKDDELPNKKEPNQLVYVRIVTDEKLLAKKIKDAAVVPFIDWALCSIKS
jgi:hypothetical protein